VILNKKCEVEELILFLRLEQFVMDW